ncbi:hypothetical protein AAHA92_21952 [Salvia divinorum]|uniref:Uncharacterized protein n=1 Tax=Salvia divinorum TaxID=28513 RepID=A0ABD1GML0_SALDI
MLTPVHKEIRKYPGPASYNSLKACSPFRLISALVSSKGEVWIALRTQLGGERDNTLLKPSRTRRKSMRLGNEFWQKKTSR